MTKVQFLRDTSKARVTDNPPDTYLVYYEGYKLPEIAGVEYLPFPKFKAVYSNLEFNKLIFVGLNRIITPTNRCDMVNDFIQTMTRNIPKVSIDTAPFVGEPWRIFYHYDVTNTGKFNVPHGYAIETEWKTWYYRETNFCRLSGDNIRTLITDTYSDLPALTTTINFHDVNDAAHYQELKTHIINKYGTPKMMVITLLKECNKRYKIKFDTEFWRTNQTISVPDLGIYRFVAEENERRKAIYNAVTQ